MNRRLQLRLWLRGLILAELQLRPKVARARNKYIKESAFVYEGTGNVPAWLKADHVNAIKQLLEDHYMAVIPQFGSMVLKQVKSVRIETKRANNLFSSFMLEWVKTEALRKAQMISDTDQGDIQRAIARGLKDGEGTASIARMIREVSILTPYRSEVIARTETHNAATFGSVETARAAENELGIVLQKVWLPTLDDRTRPEHRAMEGKDPIALGDRFEVGGETMDRPGDPSASPENIINCRCALAYEEKA